jgi:hypothetical protein
VSLICPRADPPEQQVLQDPVELCLERGTLSLPRSRLNIIDSVLGVVGGLAVMRMAVA